MGGGSCHSFGVVVRIDHGGSMGILGAVSILVAQMRTRKETASHSGHWHCVSSSTTSWFVG
jgi:hypothetical protein